MPTSPRRHAIVAFVLASVLGISGLYLARTADHSDVPQSGTLQRQDANIVDLHAFTVGPNLVMAAAINPAVPDTATSYVFPSDVTFEFAIDTDALVSTDDPFGDGGIILEPHAISEEITFRIRFNADGSARIQRVVRGALQPDARIVNFFAGLRDDPFIRGPRAGKNVGAIVLETPLSTIVGKQPTLLIWTTTKVEEFEGTFQDISGRALRSMFPEQRSLNRLHPKLHTQTTGLRPDVMIFDTSKPAAFPNGRSLTDDVVDLVGDQRVLSTDSPFPTANDLPFLDTFPYLAAPHPAK